MTLEVLRQDFTRTAWSKGLRERVAVINLLIDVLYAVVDPRVRLLGCCWTPA